ncbi:transglutaminase domain-containing protein [Clostridium neuense]|uniref:Transglutaminase domain-containing protein n=1 Tax=Clostridium neuense TaxID=1728934 RepID=A0ABW8TAP3_9CLOT
MKKLISAAVVFSIITSSLFTGCSNSNLTSKNTDSSQSYYSDTNSVSIQSIKKKYKEENKNSIMPMYNVPNNQEFDFTFKSNLENIKVQDIVSVHTDSKCLEQSKVLAFEWPKNNSNDETHVSIKPLSAVLSSQKNMTSNGAVWGNAPIYYIRINYSMNSKNAEKLDNPIIIPFTIKSDLPVPNLRKEISTDGRLKLVWDKVNGAEKYNVYHVITPTIGGDKNAPTSSAEDGYKGYPLLEATTTKTAWQDFMTDGKDGLETIGDKIVSEENSSLNGDYYVTAVAGDKESNFSIPVCTSTLNSKLPVALNDGQTFIHKFQNAAELPHSVPVKFIGGTVQNREVIYDTKNISTEDNTTLINYKIKGTALKGYTYLLSFNDSDKSLLNSFNSTNKDTSGGYVEPTDTSDNVPDPNVPTIINDKNKSDSKNSNIDTQKKNTENHITKADKEKITTSDIVKEAKISASSPLEEYLALKLINVDSSISLEAFPEAQNMNTLSDTIKKVIYQNPLILGVKSYYYDYSTLTLKIKYDDTVNVTKEKQKQILTEAKKIVSSTIKPEMSDEEKRKALYDYLDKNTRYNNAALKDAEKNNYKHVDSKFNDSFTTYGIMVKKSGVCMSYAYSYKLLCDLAKVDCMVVTGTIENCPHAWNKVKINNEWLNVDNTNNGTNSGIPYMLYESNDETASNLTYVEDKDFCLNDDFLKFAGKSNKNDYYVSNGLEVNDLSQYSTKINDFLKTNKPYIILRFSNKFDKTEVAKATVEVFKNVGTDKLSTARIKSLENYIEITTH